MKQRNVRKEQSEVCINCNCCRHYHPTPSATPGQVVGRGPRSASKTRRSPARRSPASRSPASRSPARRSPARRSA
jgi:hypothetical protein